MSTCGAGLFTSTAPKQLVAEAVAAAAADAEEQTKDDMHQAAEAMVNEADSELQDEQQVEPVHFVPAPNDFDDCGDEEACAEDDQESQQPESNTPAGAPVSTAPEAVPQTPDVTDAADAEAAEDSPSANTNLNRIRNPCLCTLYTYHLSLPSPEVTVIFLPIANLHPNGGRDIHNSLLWCRCSSLEATKC